MAAAVASREGPDRKSWVFLLLRVQGGGLLRVEPRAPGELVVAAETTGLVVVMVWVGLLVAMAVPASTWWSASVVAMVLAESVVTVVTVVVVVVAAAVVTAAVAAAVF